VSTRLVLAWTVLVCVAEAAQVPQSTQPPFSINISIFKEVLPLGSEIRVQILDKNISDHEIILDRSPAVDQGEIRHSIEVYDEKGSPVPETGYYKRLKGKPNSGYPRVVLTPTGSYSEDIIPMGSYIGFSLKPGDTLNDEAILNKSFVFTTPGKYTVRVSRFENGRKTEVKSNTITITLTDPSAK
jgi:hypothetical protein